MRPLSEANLQYTQATVLSQSDPLQSSALSRSRRAGKKTRAPTLLERTTCVRASFSGSVGAKVPQGRPCLLIVASGVGGLAEYVCVLRQLARECVCQGGTADAEGCSEHITLRN
jgi:hypothetical protein